TGPVKNAFLSPTTALTPGRSYDAVLDPSGAPSSILDFQGSSLGSTSKTFRSSVVEQENSAAATYQWGTVSVGGAFNGSYTHDRLAGASASYSFTGSSITWYTVKGPKQGLADVYI